MFTITLISQFFVKDIKRFALENNNSEKFNRYSMREGKYNFSLPEGWDIESINNTNSDIDIEFNGKGSVYGQISIIDGDLESSCRNITNIKNSIKEYKEDYNWNVISLKNNNYTERYYLRNYSEGKVLIIKFSYKDIKEKDSIKIVFDNIVMSFS